MISAIARGSRTTRTAYEASRHLSRAAANEIRLLSHLARKDGFVEVRGFNGVTQPPSNSGESPWNCDFRLPTEEEGVKRVSGYDVKIDVCWPHFSSLLGLRELSTRATWPRRGGRLQYVSTAAAEASEPSTTDGIVITDNCAKRLKEIQQEDGPEGHKKMLRLSVEGGGCSGFLYNFSLDDKQNSDDRLFEKDGVKIVVDEISLSLVKGSTIDFSEELIRASFTVATNPNAASGCGCGASFTAK